MDKQSHHDADTDFVGYVSWIEESVLFLVTLAACGSLIGLGWWIGKGAGFWS